MATLSLLRVILLLWLTEALAEAEFLAKPECQDRCGDVAIPFPFGIGPKCYMNESFAVDCKDAKPFLASIGMELLGVSVQGWVQVNNPVVSSNCNGNESSVTRKINISVSPFVYSNARNMFTATGCDNYALLRTDTDLGGGCHSFCRYQRDLKSYGCSGLDCCQAIIPPNTKSFVTTLTNMNKDYRSCNHNLTASIVDQEWFDPRLLNPEQLSQMEYVPAVLEWGAFQGLCSPSETSALFCSRNGYCWTQLSERHLCVCSESSYYYLNSISYISYGCAEGGCMNLKRSTCHLLCTYTGDRESYNCSCPDGYSSFRSDNTCYPASFGWESGKKSRTKVIIIGCSSGLGLLLLVIGGWGLYKTIKRRKAVKVREKYFKRNGGLLLQQRLSSGDNNVEQVKLFSSKELEKATDHYNVSRILGQGGQGTVYKGMLTDGKIVAIKKSKIVDQDEGKLNQFINEVVILTQINHRNVVKLLGCCLETEVPLLVYEFIPNGTLFQYINQQNDQEFPITWEMRLRIASEVAGAVSYLHSAASIPIYHRDIKSTNILLDDKYRAKIADFGTSKSIAVDQTHVTTRIQGTMGYLDPEYFQSSQFTEKSDVYSFGVVLIELLTGQKPISLMRSVEERSLVAYFFLAMQENRLFDVLDARVLKEGRKEEITAVAKLAKRCLHLNGKKRPTMKAVAMELEVIRASSEAAPSAIQKDVVPDEVDYAEGHTTGPWDTASSSSGSRLNRIAMHMEIDVQPLLSG
uniref:Protein kinase domain-containing protein n=1 Tax=Rhizophora mucronata TaxID=61149 RepID=A0A2P2MW58_RHIMU